MKNLSLLCLFAVTLMFSFAGCGAGTETVGGAIENLTDLSKFEFGGIKGDELQDKFAGVVGGLKDVNADNVDDVTEKITELDTTLEGVDTESLPAPAKTALGGFVKTFSEKLEKAMGGISDEGILGKLKPAVEPLMAKLKGMM